MTIQQGSHFLLSHLEAPFITWAMPWAGQKHRFLHNPGNGHVIVKTGTGSWYRARNTISEQYPDLVLTVEVIGLESRVPSSVCGSSVSTPGFDGEM